VKNTPGPRSKTRPEANAPPPDDATETEISAVFRDSFPDVETTGFRTATWARHALSTHEPLEPLFPTLLHAFAAAAKLAKNEGITLLPEEASGEEEHRSYRVLYRQARELAAGLQERGLQRGERVLLVMPTSFDFIVSFFAIQLAGGIAVPSYPPAALEKWELGLERLAHVARRSGATLCLTDKKLFPLLGSLADVPSMRALLKVDKLAADASRLKVKVRSDSAAFIQYTSGSTGEPKGVLLNHRNLTSNVHAIGQAVRIHRKDVVVSWLPLYHDMGLIGVLLFALYWRLPLALMSPSAFLVDPSRWLWAIHKFRGTLSAAPNFAYGLCVRRMRNEDRSGLDLSSWRLALNGAEPVNVRTAMDFCELFKSNGFAATSMYPVYGLAEASLAVTFPRPGEQVRYEIVDREALASGHVRPREGQGSVAIVCVGKPLPGHEVLVADDQGRPVGQHQVGHVLARGPSLMQGYFQNPEATAEVLRDGWLWTGDLGYFGEGGLYITGRAKDLIILRGKNHYAEDLERLAERVKGLRTGGSVAFGIYDEQKASDLAVMVCETRIQDEPLRAALVSEVIEAVLQHAGVRLHDVVLVPPGTLPKTSSGKKQRALCRKRYLSDQLVSPRSSRLKLWMTAARSGSGLLKLWNRQRGKAPPRKRS